jgi:glucokinase
MNQGFPRLLGDIGGTNARWAWQASAGADLEDISVLPCGASASLQESARSYLQSHGRQAPQWAGIGIATAITGDEVRMTNNDWRFSINEFQNALGLQRCLVINDFTSLALSLPALKPSDLRAIGGGEPVTGRTIGLLGPGTGLGVSGLIADGQGNFTALAGEGGHVTLAAADDREAAIISILRKTFSHVSAERVLSGPGLVNLYNAVCALEGKTAQAFSPADVTDKAIAKSDAQCVQAIEYFTRFLGSVAGNLALTLGSLGGMYLGGGIVPRLGDAFDEALFRQQFEAKGRYQALLQGMPVWLITASTPALVGASRALDVLP